MNKTKKCGEVGCSYCDDMPDEEYESLEYTARLAWAKYNPEWLLDKVDGVIKAHGYMKNNDDTPFDIGDVRQAYLAGFNAGVVFKITKEVDE